MERRIAVASIVLAVIHFAGETWWHFRFGQFLPMLIVDYIAIVLLLFAGMRSLHTGNAAGLLCGAWGFTFCLNYRALFSRVDLARNEAVPGSVTMEIYVLAVAFVLVGALFLLTLVVCNRQARVSE